MSPALKRLTCTFHLSKFFCTGWQRFCEKFEMCAVSQIPAELTLEQDGALALNPRE